MLILDEPTNHLDVDAREALIQALNAYSGCVVIVSHDRHMIEMTADRLVLVDSGTAREFDGSLDDYIDFVLRKEPAKPGKGKADPKAAADLKERQKALRQAVRDTEAALAKLTAKRDAIDRALIDPIMAEPALKKLDKAALLKARAALEAEIGTAEEAWLEASGAMEKLAA